MECFSRCLVTIDDIDDVQECENSQLVYIMIVEKDTLN